MKNQKRYRLSEDEWRLIDDYRQDKENKALLEEECNEAGIDVGSVHHYWYKSKRFSIFAKPNEFSRDEFLKSIEDLISNYSPSYPSIDYPKRKEGHLLVINPADVHNGVRGIISKADGFSIQKVLFCIGNDILHTDNIHGTTSRGTPQNTDGKWYRHFTTALEVYVECVEMLMNIAPVDCVHSMSNHDYMSGFHLAHALKSWFRNTDSVTVDDSPIHRKYYVYGSSLIGLTHGDGAKTNSLPLLMAQEKPKLWAKTKHRYWYLHHIHHKQRFKYLTSFDDIACTLEFLRSPSGTDAWHYQKGYCGSPKAVEGFIHSKENGQIAHLTHIF